MYVYTAELPDDQPAPLPRELDVDEGLLKWMREVDVVNPNRLVVDNIYHFAPEMLAGVVAPCEYRCHYDDDGHLRGVTVHDIFNGMVTYATATE